MKWLICSLLITSAYGQEIKDPWVKAIPPNMKMSAAYMTIVNNTDKKIELTSARSKVSEYVEIHTHKNVDGVMKMRQIKSIIVKAKGKHILKPKADHLMLIQLKKPIKEGDVVDLELTFSNGKVISLKASVRKM